jgi:hypothetical protein
MRKRVTVFELEVRGIKAVLHASFKSLARHEIGVFLFLKPGGRTSPQHPKTDLRQI